MPSASTTGFSCPRTGVDDASSRGRKSPAHFFLPQDPEADDQDSAAGGHPVSGVSRGAEGRLRGGCSPRWNPWAYGTTDEVDPVGLHRGAVGGCESVY